MISMNSRHRRLASPVLNWHAPLKGTNSTHWCTGTERTGPGHTGAVHPRWGAVSEDSLLLSTSAAEHRLPLMLQRSTSERNVEQADTPGGPTGSLPHDMRNIRR